MIFSMPEQTFGGDDDKGQQPQQPAKKLDLKKYASKPDMNIRDIFWDLMASYATKKNFTKDELKPLSHERIPLMRIALNVVENPQSAYFGLSRNLTALYSIMVLLDGGWDDAFEQFIVKSYEENEKPVPTIVAAINKTCENEKYKEQIKLIFKKMTRNHDQIHAVLAYLSKIGNNDILTELKKEVMIIARSDIEKNQYYAMLALARIMDNDAKSTLIGLINHWDIETRKTALDLLKKEKDPRINEIAKRQLQIESDPAIKKILAKIISANKEGV